MFRLSAIAKYIITTEDVTIPLKRMFLQLLKIDLGLWNTLLDRLDVDYSYKNYTILK